MTATRVDDPGLLAVLRDLARMILNNAADTAEGFGIPNYVWVATLREALPPEPTTEEGTPV